jgi:hypothetical protein
LAGDRAVALGRVNGTPFLMITTAVYTIYGQESVPTRWQLTTSGAYFVAATLGMAVAGIGGRLPDRSLGVSCSLYDRRRFDRG